MTLTRLSSPSHLSTNYFAVINKQNEIQGVVEATPAQPKNKNCIPLTEVEFEVLRVLSLHKIYEREGLKALQSIQRKIKARKGVKHGKS
jgi:hypothetical protein